MSNDLTAGLHNDQAAGASPSTASRQRRSSHSSSSEVAAGGSETLEARMAGFHLGEGPLAVTSQSPQSRKSNLRMSNSFSGSHTSRNSHRSLQSVTTIKSLDSTLADGHSHIHPTSIGRYVRFNVGGCLYFTTIGTVCKRDTMLRAMFTGDLAVQVDNEGFVLLDRSGKHFGELLSYLRDGAIPLPDGLQESSELLMEAKYYLFEELADQLVVHVEQLRKDSMALCRMAMVTSSEEFQKILLNTNKPIICLNFNRFHNKYSYTGSSDDNLLKHLELFDRLATRFMDRVMFVKDIVGGDAEICTWMFYGHGKRQAEITCDAIVYATDNKHIKIDFPEAKIYEECLNIMLFEERVLDAERAAAAAQNQGLLLSRRSRPGPTATSDSDN